MDSMSIRGLKKSYGTNTVLRGIDLTFEAGQIHALLGPNGAGKSTLLGCLSGAVRPDEGTIVVNGVSHTGFTPQSALSAGTAIIYQHLELIDDLSSEDNIFLGSELRSRAGTVRRSTQRRVATELLGQLGARFDATRPLRELSAGQKQVVEIAKALRHRPQVLILDEPTAALSVRETESLLALVTKLAHDSGLAIVYVTHLLREVTAIADVVTVLRDGAVDRMLLRGELTHDALVDGITGGVHHGGPARRSSSLTASDSRSPRVVLESFSAAGAPPVDLRVQEGEVVGVFGLLGSGRTNLIEALAGARPSSGDFMLNGVKVAPSSVRRARRAGIALVPADRKQQSLFGDLTAQENVLLPHYRRLARWCRRRSAEDGAFDQVADRMALHPRLPKLSGDQFSGGNAQKLVMGRWLMEGGGVELLLLDEPTQGVDVGARSELHAMIREFAAQGRAVIFVSSDVEELAALADRVVVMAASRITGVVPSDTSERDLLLLAQPEPRDRTVSEHVGSTSHG